MRRFRNFGSAFSRETWGAALLLAFLLGSVFAAESPIPTTIIVDRGRDHETHEMVTQIGDGPDATLVTNRFTLLQPGMNYLESNVWKSSSAQIDLAPGGALYQKGPFGINFKANYKNGPMEVTLPDGRTMKIRTVGLALTHADGDSVWLGESKSANGFLDADGSTVVYADAFDGVRADIVVHVGVGRFESDVVIREQLLDPATLNWDPAQVKVEIWHELTQAPEADSFPGVIHREDGRVDADEQLGIGGIFIGQGSAFLMGTNKLPLLAGGKRVQVAKERFRDPQSQVSYMIESVPYLEAVGHLTTLPARHEARVDRDSLLKRLEGGRNIAAGSNLKRRPPVSIAGIESDPGKSNGDRAPEPSKGKRLASIIERGSLSDAPGFVMDYSVVVGSSNARLKGDTTYYVTNEVNFFGTTTIEAGTVVKFTNFVTLSGSSPAFKVHGPLVCLTTPYAPAVFTAQNDNSVGEIINANDTSAPSGYYANYNLVFTPENTVAIDVHDIQTRYAYYGLSLQGSGVNKASNVQAVKCSTGLEAGYNTTYVRNFLAHDTVNALNAISAVIRAEHVTAHNAAGSLFSHTGSTSYLYITNSLSVAVASQGSNVQSDNLISQSTDAGIFAVVGAGANYLASASPYRNVGNPNLSPEMKAILKVTTTHPPVELKNAISTSQTLRPRALLDGDAPDLGCHFYPLDYLWTELPVTGATLLLTNGVSVGWYGKNGTFLAKDSKLISEGKPNRLNRIVRYTAVQEQPTILGANSSGASAVLLATNGLSVANRPDIQLRFTEVGLQANSSSKRWFLYSPSGGGSTGAKNLSVENSHFKNINFTYSVNAEAATVHTVGVTNNIFERSTFSIDRYNGTYSSLNVWNNLFTYSSVLFNEGSGASLPTAYIKDNMFDTCTTSQSGTLTYQSNGHNAYFGTTALGYSYGNNVTLSAVNFTSSYYGRFYSPGSGGLASAANAGSRMAATARLAQFTTLASQAKEKIGTVDSQVDIGFHYLAAGSDGLPMDTDLDGIPDYQEDKNGDGATAGVETNFLAADTDGDGLSDSEEINMGTNPLVAGAGAKRRLASWSFSDPSFLSDDGEPPVAVTGGVTGGTTAICFDKSAAHVTGTDPILSYREVNATGIPNLSRTVGTVRFWFRPDWLLTGTPPNQGRLISLGTANLSSGQMNWWDLQITNSNSQWVMVFQSQAGATALQHFMCPLPPTWNRSVWHYLVLTYDSTGVRLFWDGEVSSTDPESAKVAASGVQPIEPAISTRANERITFGNARDGGSAVGGHFDNIQTFNYAWTAKEVLSDYKLATAKDDDHDGLSNLTEINDSNSNPYNFDTDGDGIPDGWEYAWKLRYPSSSPNFNLRSSGGADTDWDKDFDSDGRNNRQEYLMGTNPFRGDTPAVPVTDNKAATQSSLLNIAFGSDGSTTPSAWGMAAAGFDGTDKWNHVTTPPDDVTPRVGLVYADGSASGVGVTLRMHLGHVTRFTVQCDVTQPPGGNYCSFLNISNFVHDIFCCQNITDQAADRPARYYCLHSDTGEVMYLSDQTTTLTRYIENPLFNRSLPGSLNAGIPAFLPQTYYRRSLLPEYPWATYPGWGSWVVPALWWSNPGDPTPFERYVMPGGDMTFPSTTVRAFAVTAPWFYQVGDTIRVPPSVSKKVVPTPEMESAWILGFDTPGTIENAARADLRPFMSSYLVNSKDGLFSSTSMPHSMDCNSFWFTGDAHASITISGLPLGSYRLFLYGGKGGAPSVTPITVNGTGSAIFYTPGLTQFIPWANCSEIGVGYTESITIEYPEPNSIINAIQIYREPESATISSVTAVFDDLLGVRVDWTPADGFGYRVYRQVAGVPEVLIADHPNACSIHDTQFPLDTTLQYRVAAVDRFGIERGSQLSASITPITGSSWTNVAHHAPTLNSIKTLRHTYKNMDFVIGAPRLMASSDAFDFDGDEVFFEITEVSNGTLRVDADGQTPVSYTPASTFPSPGPVVGPGVRLTWTPPNNQIGREIPAFKVRAFDGALRSPTAVPVKIEVRDTSVAYSWGTWNNGLKGDGHSSSSFFYDSVQREQFSKEPEMMTVALDQVPTGADRTLTNIVQFAISDDREDAGFQRTRAALRADGTVWTWGQGFWGGLGDDFDRAPKIGNDPKYPRIMTFESTRPRKVTDLADITSIASGVAYLMALRSDGTVWAWGEGGNGQLGCDRTLLKAVSLEEYNFSDVEMDAVHWVLATSKPLQVLGLPSAAGISACKNLSIAWTATGELYWWGNPNSYNYRLQPGAEYAPIHLDVPGRVVQAVAAWGNRILALTDNGKVYSLDYSSDTYQWSAAAQVSIARAISIAAGWGREMAILQDGTVVEWGVYDENNGPAAVRNLKNITHISTNGRTAFAADSDGRLFGWGYGDFGLLQQDFLPKPERAIGPEYDIPAYGFYKAPIQLDAMDWIETTGVSRDAAFAAGSLTTLYPRDLTAVSGDKSVQLSWKPMPGATRYEIQRSESGNPVTVAVIPNDARAERLSWTDTAVVNQHHYFYQIAAVIAGTRGDFSPPVDGWPDAAPPQVTGLTVEPAARMAHVYWNPVPGKVNYEIWRKKDSEAFALYTNIVNFNPTAIQLCSGGMSASSKVEAYDIHLAPSSTYYYEVRAVNDVGAGAYSSVANTGSISSSASSISAPTFGTTDQTGEGALVRWTTSATPPAGHKFFVNVYIVVDQLVGSTWAEVRESLVSQDIVEPSADGINTFAFATRSAFKYRVKVSEFGLCDGEGPSATLNLPIVNSHGATPSAPTDLVLVSGPGSLYARWRGSAFNYMINLYLPGGGTALSGEGSCGAANAIIVEPDDNGVAEFFIAGLSAGTGYSFQITQVWLEDAMPPAPDVVRTVNIASPSSSLVLPSMLVQPANNRLRITWWDGQPDPFAAMVAYGDWRFILQKQGPDQSGACPAWITVYDGKEFGVDDFGVVNGSNYKYRLIGINHSLEVGKIESATYTPAPAFSPSATLTVTPTPFNHAIRLSWPKVIKISDSTEADEYEVLGSSVKGGPHRTLAVLSKGSALTYLDLNLDNGRRYYYQVIARSVNGEALVSQEVSEVPTEQNLIQPFGISVSLGQGRANVSWLDVPGAEGYSFTYSGQTYQTRNTAYSVAQPLPIQAEFVISATRRGSTASSYLSYLSWKAPTGVSISKYIVRKDGVEVARLDNSVFEYSETRVTSASVTYTVKALLTDSTEVAVNARTTVTDTIRQDVTVQLNDLPASIVSPTNIVVSAAIVNKSVSVVDRVEFYVDNILVGTDASAPDYFFTWVNPAAGSHTLVARMVDTDGLVAVSASKTVTVSLLPELKSFQTAETDLQISAPGLPLNVSRSYDSRNLEAGMLGKGWKLDWERAGMTVPDLSYGWSVVISANILHGNTLLESPVHVMEVRLPGGGVQSFHPSAGPVAFGGGVYDDENNGTIEYGFDATLNFEPLPGSDGYLSEVEGITSIVVPGPDGWTQILRNSGSMFPLIGGQREDSYKGFRYTDTAGYRYTFSQPTSLVNGARSLQLVSMQNESGIYVDRNSIALPAGVLDGFELYHANGTAVTFEKVTDAIGYAWLVYDPVGRPAAGVTPTAAPVVKYKVDSANSLLKEVHVLIDRATSTYSVTKYQYDSSSRLIRVINNDNIIVLENTYDSSSPQLLASQMDMLGLKRTTTTTAGSGGAVTVDVTDNAEATPPAVHASYDASGQITTISKDGASSETVSIAYDDHGRPVGQAQNGQYTSYTFDGDSSRVTSVTDALNNTTITDYNGAGNPSATYDAKGSPTVYTYHPKPEIDPPTGLNTPYNPEGMLASVTDAEGNSAQYVYNVWGQILAETRIQGRGDATPVTTYVYYDGETGGRKGDLKEVRSPLWRSDDANFYVTSFTYDGNGNKLTETQKRRDRFNATQTITTTYTFDGRNRVATTTDALSQVSSSVYDSNGKVTQSTDSLGQVTSYRYDPRGNLIQTTYPDGTVSRTVYDNRGRATWSQDRCTVSGTDTVGPATETVFDSLGRASIVRRHENTTVRLNTMTAVTETDSITVNQNYRKLSGTTPPSQYQTSVPSGSEGTVASSTRSTYDSLGRLDYSVDSMGGLTRYAYDALGRKSSVTRYVDYVVPDPIETSTINPPGTAVLSVTTYGYDSNGNQAWVRNGNQTGGTDANTRTDFEYDRLNRQKAVTYPLVTGETTRKRFTTEYDGLGRRVLETDEAGISTAYQYDILGRLTNVINGYKAQYDLGETPAQTYYRYDEVGNERIEIRLTYTQIDEAGHLIQFPNPSLTENTNRSTVFEYDVLGRRTHRFLPGAGTSTAGFTDTSANALMEKTTYSRVASGGAYLAHKDVQDFRGKVIGYDYDKMGRLVTRTLPLVTSGADLARTISYTYTGPLLTQVTETGTGLSRTDYLAYDDSRRLQRKDSPEGVLTYTYNKRSQVETIKGYARSAVTVNVAPSGSVARDVDVQYGYDPLGRLRTIQNNKTSGSSIISTNRYDLAGNLIETSFPNQTRQQLSYTEQNRLKSVAQQTVTTGGVQGLLRQYDYTLNAAGLRTYVKESSAPTTVRREVTYGYDTIQTRPVVGVIAGAVAPDGSHPNDVPLLGTVQRLNRLTSETYGSGTTPPHANYEYDLVGNRVKRTDTGGVGVGADQNFAFDDTDRYTGTSAPMTTDANGNTTSSAGGTTTDYYDAENRLVKRVVTGTGAKTITMGYDTSGNRVWKTVQTGSAYLTTYYLVDDRNPTGYAQVLAEYTTTLSGPSPVAAAFTQGYEYGQRLISQRHYSLGTFYFGYDGQGSIRNVTSTGGGLLLGYYWDYDAWGNQLNSVNTSMDFHYRYTGEQWDADLGMYYLRARYYSPQHGRFWSMDSFEGLRTEPSSSHKFAYCHNDGINHSDPSGKFEGLVGALSAAGLQNTIQEMHVTTISSVAFGVTKSLQAFYAKQTVKDAVIDYVEDIITSTVAAYQIFGALGAAFEMEVSTEASIAAATEARFQPIKLPKGTKLYRVTKPGGEWSKYWTTIDPRKVRNFADAAGLPLVGPIYDGEAVIYEAEVISSEGFTIGPAENSMAIPAKSGGGPGNSGGLSEVRIDKSVRREDYPKMIRILKSEPFAPPIVK